MRALVLPISIASAVALLVVMLVDALLGDAASSARGFIVALAAFVGGGTGWATHFALRGRRREATVLAFGTIAIVIGTVFSVVVRRSVSLRASHELTGSDRHELELVELDGESVLQHPTLGFRLPRSPMPLRESSVLEREMTALGGDHYGHGHAIWAFESADHLTTVALDLSIGDRRDRAALDELVAHVTDPLEQNGATVERGASMEIGRCFDRLVYARLASGGHLAARVTLFRRGEREFRSVVTAVGEQDLRAFLAGIAYDCGALATSDAGAR